MRLRRTHLRSLFQGVMVIVAGAVGLAACQTTTPTFDTTAGPYIDPVCVGNYPCFDVIAVGPWSIGCNINQRDPYGARISPDYCWMNIYSPESLPNTVRLNGTVLIMDERGPRLEQQRQDDPLCSPQPARVAVDGNRIDQLPMSQQVEAILNGQTFVREQARGWPYCNLYNAGTTLPQIKEAYPFLLQLWAAHGAIPADLPRRPCPDPRTC